MIERMPRPYWFSEFPEGSGELGKRFNLNTESLGKAASGILEKANSGSNPEIFKRLNYYAGLPGESKSRFVLAKSDYAVGAIDVLATTSADAKVSFTLGVGEFLIFFVNNNALPDVLIFKLKKVEEIKNFEELARAVTDFILLEPKKDETVDISKKGMQERMLKHTAKSSV